MTGMSDDSDDTAYPQYLNPGNDMYLWYIDIDTMQGGRIPFSNEVVSGNVHNHYLDIVPLMSDPNNGNKLSINLYRNVDSDSDLEMIASGTRTYASNEIPGIREDVKSASVKVFCDKTSASGNYCSSAGNQQWLDDDFWIGVCVSNNIGIGRFQLPHLDSASSGTNEQTFASFFDKGDEYEEYAYLQRHYTKDDVCAGDNMPSTVTSINLNTNPDRTAYFWNIKQAGR